MRRSRIANLTCTLHAESDGETQRTMSKRSHEIARYNEGLPDGAAHTEEALVAQEPLDLADRVLSKQSSERSRQKQ